MTSTVGPKKKSTVETLAEKGVQVYVTYYVKKQSLSNAPTKGFFTASGHSEAIEKLYKSTNTKSIDDFRSVVLMEMLVGNNFAEVLVKDSAITAAVIKNNGDAEVMSNVVSIADHKDKMGKGKKGKPHIKMGWLSTKIQDSGETRILNAMKYLVEGTWRPAELTVTAPSTPVGHATTPMGPVNYDDDEAVAKYYGYGYGGFD